jgi:hypothetical protein
MAFHHVVVRSGSRPKFGYVDDLIAAGVEVNCGEIARSSSGTPSATKGACRMRTNGFD